MDAAWGSAGGQDVGRGSWGSVGGCLVPLAPLGRGVATGLVRRGLRKGPARRGGAELKYARWWGARVRCLLTTRLPPPRKSRLGSPRVEAAPPLPTLQEKPSGALWQLAVPPSLEGPQAHSALLPSSCRGAGEGLPPGFSTTTTTTPAPPQHCRRPLPSLQACGLPSILISFAA